METARPATRAELDETVELWRRAVRELDGQRGGGPLAGSLTHEDLPGYLSSALDDPDRLIVLGFIDSVPVGVASLWRRPPGPIASLELVFVEPTARQVGVAEAMIDVVLDRCRAWGAEGLDAPALPGNRGAKSFFEVHGFQARLLVMHRSVGPAPPAWPVVTGER